MNKMLSKPLISVFDNQIISLMFRPRRINFLFSKGTDNSLQRFVKCLHSGLKQNSFKLLQFRCATNVNIVNNFTKPKTLLTNINSLSTFHFNISEEKLKNHYQLVRKRIKHEPEVSNLSCNYYSNSLIHNDTSQEHQISIKSIRKLIGKLPVDERREILLDLQLEEAAIRKKEAEEKLASWHWRSKFGRPTSVHPSTVDPSGTYCEIPQDWLMKKVAEGAKISPPTFSDLRKMAVFNALPFVGFGFLDNFIMIVAGDYIDITIGIYLGISTMAAAALGNTISDLAGIGSAWYVEFVASKIGVRPPDLSQEQQDMSSTRWSANIGRGVGVCVGCLLGMFPLLWLPKHSRSDKAKKHEESQDKN